jgi:MFS family permease
MARIEPGIFGGDLARDFGLTSSRLGEIVSLMYLPYVILQIPGGIIVDKIGVRAVIAGSSLLCGFGAFLFGSASGVLSLQLGRIVTGIAAAAAFLCCSKVAADKFDARKYSLLMGITMMMGCLGGIVATTPIAFLVSCIGWRNVTFVTAAVGVVVAIIAFFALKENKSSEEKGKSSVDVLGGLKVIARKPKAWLLGFYGAVAYLPLSAFAELWVVPFLEKRFSITTTEASTTSMLIFIGYAAGGVIGAWIAEKINSYKKTIIWFTVGVVVSFSLAIYCDQISYFVCAILFFIGGTLAGASTLAFTIATNLVPKEYSGTATGFLNALIMSSGIVFQPLLGKLLDFFRDGLTNDDSLPIYTAEMYKSAFFVVIIFMVLALISTFFVDDVRSKPE